jgi:hypothetical protein
MYVFYNTETKDIRAKCKRDRPKDTFVTPDGKKLTYGGNELMLFKQLMKNKSVEVKSQQFRKNVKIELSQHVSISKNIVPRKY